MWLVTRQGLILVSDLRVIRPTVESGGILMFKHLRLVSRIIEIFALNAYRIIWFGIQFTKKMEARVS